MPLTCVFLNLSQVMPHSHPQIIKLRSLIDFPPFWSHASDRSQCLDLLFGPWTFASPLITVCLEPLRLQTHRYRPLLSLPDYELSLSPMICLPSQIQCVWPTSPPWTMDSSRLMFVTVTSSFTDITGWLTDTFFWIIFLPQSSVRSLVAVVF